MSCFLSAGIGAQERALRNLKIAYEVIATCDCDKDAVLSYAAMRCDFDKNLAEYNFPDKQIMIDELQAKNIGYNFKDKKHTITNRTMLKKVQQYYLADQFSKNLGDISKVEKLPYADLVTYSFPCTDVSVAGRGEGLLNKCDCGYSWEIDFSNASEAIICPKCGAVVASSTRSGLLGQVQRLLVEAHKDETLPKYLLLENVKNLVGKKFKPQFDTWIKWLDSIGYNTYYQVLNAKNYGMPQNRERVFAVSIRKDIDDNKFQFPKSIPLKTRLKDVLEQNVDEKYYLPDDRINKILNAKITASQESVQDEIRVVGNYMPSGHDASRVVDVEGIAPTVKENHGTVTAIAEPQIIKVGQVSSDGSQAGMVYSPDGLSPTICAGCHGYAIGNILEKQEPFIVASRGRNPANSSDTTIGTHTEQKFEPNFSGTTNCLTSVAKDNYICEPQVLRAERTEYGKAIRKQYEAGEIDERIGNMREMKPRTDGIANTITTLLKDNYVAEPVIVEDFYQSREPRLYQEVAPTPRSERTGLKVADIVEYPCSTRGKQVASAIRASIYKQGARNLEENVINGLGYEGVIEQKPQLGFVGEGKKELKMLLNEDIKWRIRKLTTKECWRLMGFTDKDHDKAMQHTSDSALYKQAGNSIVTNCLTAIFYSLFYKDSSDKYKQYLINFND